MPISIPTLAVNDNADGTGGVATISAGDVDSMHDVFVQAVDGELGTSAWTNAGSRVGNGNVNIAVAPGFYWVKVEAANGSESVTSNLVYTHFTDGEQAVLYRCLVAVQARIQGMALAGIANERIVIRKVPDDRNVAKPAVVIAPLRQESLDPAEGTNNRDDVGYPVIVAALDADNQNPSSNHDRNLLWRERLRQAFHHQRLPGVDEIINGTVEPLPIVDTPAWFDRNTYMTAMIVRLTSRERRGLS
jgi:hypothetical protein